MEINDIKAKLTLAEVLKYYNLKPDKNLRLNCPFHEDKTPSMQVYYKTHTAFCFSSKCKTHGKSLDVIDVVMYKENITKHEAIEKCKAMINGTTANTSNNGTFNRTQFLTNIFTYFKNAVHNSKPAKEYITSRNLDFTKLEIGYNTGQFHHGTRKDEQLINNCIQAGLLSDTQRLSRTGDTAYKPFAKFCIVFALRNRANQVTGLYFRSTVNNEESKHFYLKDRSGIYPGYPKQDTQKLIITEALIDAASLLQLKPINENHSIISAYGTNGLNEEIKQAIVELKNLSEIVFAFDNDDAGNTAAEKYSNELKQALPNIIFSKLELPCKDVNETLLAHQPEIITHLINERTLFFSTEQKQKPVEKIKSIEQLTLPIEQAVKTILTEVQPKQTLNIKPETLDCTNPNKLIYKTLTATYTIQGGIDKQLNRMQITLVTENKDHYKSRNRVDLYEDKQVEKLCKEVSEKLNLRKDLVEVDIYKLTDLLDQYREKEMQLNEPTNPTENMQQQLTPEERNTGLDFLKKPKVIKRLNELFGMTGIVGEERNRIFLGCIAISHIQKETLHALIQGSSGSGKTRLLKQISDCMPTERVTKLTRISDKVLYNYPEKYFINRLLCLEDIDGLSEEAEFALRELISNGELNSATSQKLENGQIVAGQKRVLGPIASMACTTHGEIFEDNMGRVFLVAVDESKEKIKKVIDYQNAKAAWVIDSRKEEATKKFIQIIVSLLKPYEIQNPYAQKIFLPEDAHKILRLNEMFQHFVKIVTLINQYQRKKNERGQLISAKEDITTAVEIMFESIVLKVDELDGSLRQFFEKLKNHLQKTYSTNYQKTSFTQMEIRKAFNMSKAQVNKYLNRLNSFEYIEKSGGYENKGTSYKIRHWDNYKALRDRIKTDLANQIKNLE